MSNHWRALAQMARDRIVNSPAGDLEHILSVSLAYIYTYHELGGYPSHPIALVSATKLSLPATTVQPNIRRMREPLRRPQKRRAPPGSVTPLRHGAPVRAGDHARTPEVLGRRPPWIPRRPLASASQVQGSLSGGG